jgi:hypothetical protein
MRSTRNRRALRRNFTPRRALNYLNGWKYWTKFSGAFQAVSAILSPRSARKFRAPFFTGLAARSKNSLLESSSPQFEPQTAFFILSRMQAHEMYCLKPAYI